MRKNYRTSFLRCLILTLLASLTTGANAYVFHQRLWVGEESNEMDATIYVRGYNSVTNTSWYGGLMTLSGSGYVRTAYTNRYFSGTTTVSFTYEYRYTPSSQWIPGRQEWEFECIENPVSIYPKNLTIQMGQTGRVSYRHDYNNQYSQWANVTFSSDRPDIAQVDNYGNITPVSPGTAYIKVSSNLSGIHTYDQTCRVYVEKIDPEEVSIPSSLTVYVDENTTVTPTLYPTNAQTTYKWYSEDRDIATVSDGVVKGIEEGNTRIYCITANDKESNRCDVSVKYRTPTGITVSPTKVELPLHKSQQLSFSVKPSNAKTEVTWHVEDDRIAEISETGYLKPIAPGKTRVYAETDNHCKGFCEVTVFPDPQSITLPGKLLIMYGDSRKINYKVEPADAYKELNWTTDNNSVVRVNSDGIVEAIGGGTAFVTVTSHNGVSSTCQIDVPDPDFRIFVWLNEGQTISYPLKDHPKAIFTDDAVNIIAEDIKAEFPKDDFRKFTLAKEAISPMPSAIEMPSSLTLKYGDTYLMPYTLLPTDYEFDTSVTWSTSDDHVATVSSLGLVRAVGGGETEITAEATNGCKAVCRVEVPYPEFYFIVWLKNGSKTVTHLREKPMIKYGDDTFTLVTTSNETEYSSDDIQKVTLADNPEGNKSEGIFDPILDRPHLSTFDSETMAITGGRPNEQTLIFDLKGVVVASFRSDCDGTTIIPLESLPTGVLIIKSESLTYKIIKK